MRIRRTVSYCAMRSDCCMSVTFDCTRDSLLLKSKRRSTATSTSTVTTSAIESWWRVKPPWSGHRSRPPRWRAIVPSSEGLDRLDGDRLAAAQDGAELRAVLPRHPGLGAVDLDRDHLQVDVVRRRRAVLVLGLRVELAVRHGGDRVLGD